MTEIVNSQAIYITKGLNLPIKNIAFPEAIALPIKKIAFPEAIPGKKHLLEIFNSK